MPDRSDIELLQNYRRQGSEEDFAILVRRNIDLVYSAAIRHVGIAAHAEEITQTVFVILARSADRLRLDIILEGWLYETTRLTSLSFLRGERRRKFREQEAYMRSNPDESDDALVWNLLAPVLDEAMSRLGKKDRDAVVLRFFKEKSLREVAVALRVTEAAAQSRVHRAVEKLRKHFNKRGIRFSAAVLTVAISANSIQAAPAALAGAAASAAVMKGSIASASTLSLAKATMNAMALLKAKLTFVIGIAALLVGGTVSVVFSGGFSGDKDSQSVDGRQPVMINALFLKAPILRADTVIADIANSNVIPDQQPEAFQKLLNQFTDVSIVGARRVAGSVGNQTTVSITRPVQIDRTFSETGIILRVTPSVQSDTVRLNLQTELRELKNGSSPTIKVTRQEQTQLVKTGEAAIMRNPVSGGVQAVNISPGEPSETLLTFVWATLDK